MKYLVFSIQNRTICLLFIGLLGLCTGCQKDEAAPKPDLPPLTTEGKNTFGCYINGVPWKEGKPGFNLGGPTLESWWFVNKPNDDGSLVISASKYYSMDESPIKHDWLILEAVFTENSQKNLSFNERTLRRWLHGSGYCEYQIDTTTLHEMNLNRFDLQERVASGTFEFKLYNSLMYNTTICQDTLVITDGRFDVRFSIE